MTLNYHSRVLLFVVGLLFLSLVGAAAAMFVATYKTAYEIAGQRLDVAERVVQKSLDNRQQQLRAQVQTLAADYGFREAVTSQDMPTVISALQNQSSRVDADLVAIINVDGGILASTDVAFDTVPAFALEEKNRTRTAPSAFVRFKGQLLQVIIVPIRAPMTVGWIYAGFFVRDDDVRQIREISGADVSMVIADDGAMARVIASTLAEKPRQSLAEAARGAIAEHDVHVVKLDGGDYLTAAAPMLGSVDANVHVVVQFPKQSIAAPLSELQWQLLWYFGIVILLGLAAALFGARKLVQPVQALTTVARSLRLSKRRSAQDSPRDDDDLSHLTAAFHSLARRAHYDALTGLPNRTLVMERIADSLMRAEQAGEQVAVVFADLNGFKGINDTLGHEVGDLVLRKTAQRLSRSVAAHDTVARLGGDEFVVVLENTSQTGALKTLDHLISVVGTPMRAPAGPIKVGMSAGIALFPIHARDREALLRLADAAMYQSKTRKLGPVLAKGEDVGSNPTRAEKPTVTPPVRIEPDSFNDTWGTGKWQGQDLATQRLNVLAEKKS